MAPSLLRLILPCVCFISCFTYIRTTEYVPVFMWDSASDVKSIQNIPALAKINYNQFKDLLETKLQQKDVVVVFIEENLSIEDFSWHDASGQGSYPQLEALSVNLDTIYLPNVHTPLHSINSLIKMKHMTLTPDGLVPELSNDTLLLINLVDATGTEDRPHLLKRHDSFMTDIYSKLLKIHDRVTAIYTAHHSSWSDEEFSMPELLQPRSKRAISELENEGEIVNNATLYNGDDTIYLYTTSIPLLILEGKNVTLGTPIQVTTANATDGTLAQLIVEYDDATIRFNFRTTYPGYWGLNDVIVSERGSRSEITLVSSLIEAPIGFSYHCSQQVQFAYVNKTETDSTLTFLSMQVQPFLPVPDEGKTPKFSDAYDCVYFFTAPILSGFFVTILFAWIMGLGICMIMDIKTMDRFDDPKGKTINVNATE